MKNLTIAGLAACWQQSLCFCGRPGFRSGKLRGPAWLLQTPWECLGDGLSPTAGWCAELTHCLEVQGGAEISDRMAEHGSLDVQGMCRKI